MRCTAVQVAGWRAVVRFRQARLANQITVADGSPDIPLTRHASMPDEIGSSFHECIVNPGELLELPCTGVVYTIHPTSILEIGSDLHLALHGAWLRTARGSVRLSRKPIERFTQGRGIGEGLISGFALNPHSIPFPKLSDRVSPCRVSSESRDRPTRCRNNHIVGRRG